MMQYYTVKEFAEILMVHPSTIRRAINNGHIVALRVGYGKKSTFRIHKTEIERMSVFHFEMLVLTKAKELNEKELQSNKVSD